MPAGPPLRPDRSDRVARCSGAPAWPPHRRRPARACPCRGPRSALRFDGTGGRSPDRGMVRLADGWRRFLRHDTGRLGGSLGPLLGPAAMFLKPGPRAGRVRGRSILPRLEFTLVAGIGAASLISMLATAWSVAASAHPGGLAADGCHSDRRNGGRHCHRGSSSPAPNNRPSFAAGVRYPNCAAARAAGAAPVRRGDPGYGSHLDRDGDGVGCE